MFDVPQKFYELCRLCLSLEGAKYHIFEVGDDQHNFAEKISACLSITVSACWRFANYFAFYKFATICSYSVARPVYASLRLRRSHRHRAIALSLALCSLARSALERALARALSQDSESLLLAVSLQRSRSRIRDRARTRAFG